ncbi:MAG: hypothetical protein KG003_08110 [Bacteroidetes bacterium]|nr:hypothetical protein [Bacteroidota bacterium]
MYLTQKLIDEINKSSLNLKKKEDSITALMRIESNRGANFSPEGEVLSEFFIWDRTVEGQEFWVEINEAIFLKVN